MLASARETIVLAASTRSMPSGSAIFSRDRLLRQSGVAHKGAPQEVVCRDVPQHHVGVGDGGQLSALSVARRAGIGADALRSDADTTSRSIRAMDPPPAPMLVVSMLSTAFFWSPMTVSVVVGTMPPGAR